MAAAAATVDVGAPRFLTELVAEERLRPPRRRHARSPVQDRRVVPESLHVTGMALIGLDDCASEIEDGVEAEHGRLGGGLVTTRAARQHLKQPPLVILVGRDVGRELGLSPIRGAVDVPVWSGHVSPFVDIDGRGAEERVGPTCDGCPKGPPMLSRLSYQLVVVMVLLSPSESLSARPG